MRGVGTYAVLNQSCNKSSCLVAGGDSFHTSENQRVVAYNQIGAGLNGFVHNAFGHIERHQYACHLTFQVADQESGVVIRLLING